MFFPASTSDYEFIEKKSRFIARAERIDSVEQPREIVKQLRKNHPAARHVVHAFVLGKKAEVHGASDDGEPSGTAGKPVLELIKGRDVTNIIITVIRYFGGIKLGTGGLVRAYSQAARGALEGLVLEEQIDCVEFKIECPYSVYEIVKSALLKAEARIVKENFTEDIEIEGIIPQKMADGLEKTLLDISGGKIELKIIAFGG